MRPDIKVLLVSGFTSHIVAHGSLGNAFTTIQKPYSLATLQNAILMLMTGETARPRMKAAR